MNLGLIVEDSRDSYVYEELARKIRSDISAVVPLSCQGPVKRRFIGFLKYLKWSSSQSINKALVIRDSDRLDPQTCEAQLEEEYQRSHFDAGFPVHFHATKTELESWLLADENAINQVSLQRGKNRTIGPVNFDLESYQSAKELFQSRLSDARLPADPQVYREVAACADVRRIAARCPSFRLFEEKLHNC